MTIVAALFICITGIGYEQNWGIAILQLLALFDLIMIPTVCLTLEGD